MTAADLPVLVVVTGPPATGKTTIARAISAELRLPLVSKDDIKEALFDALGTGDRDWSRALGVATTYVMFLWLAEELRAGRSVVTESNFDRSWADARFAELPPHRPLQIHCSATAEVVLERYASRERHAGHLGSAVLPELEAALAEDRHAPLTLAGELIELDTTSFEHIDVDDLIARVRGRLSPAT